MTEQISSETFFRDMPALNSYRDITVPANLRPAPRDWHVVVTDVVNSTGAIETGNYKNVNVLGATTIVGLLNAAGAIEIPFVFGGDGASCLIPPSLLPEARRVLVVAKNRARRFFNLELRAGIVPVGRIIADGFDVRVAKLRVSERFAQAVFAGGGLSRAEQLIKHPSAGEQYELPPDPLLTDADFSGLECRWNPVRSDKDEIVSLLIQARGGTDAAKNEVYLEVIAEIEKVFGETGGYHPVTQPALALAERQDALLAELKTRHGHRPVWRQKLCLWRMLFQNRVGNFLLGKPLRFAGVDWGNYKRILIENTDYQKFDDLIRMVISCSTRNRENFEEYLKQQHCHGKLFYGLHVTDSALLTCLVFDRCDRHFHFVDGSNGGYALAAKALKRQIREADSLFI